MTRRLLIKNIKGLVQVETETRLRKRSGAEMKNLPMLEDAWLALEEDRITGFGSMEDWDGISDWNGLEVIDATGKFVLPCWNDPHTHIVYAGSRETEFVDKINGLSYEEIAKKGGGILNSAKRLSLASEDELYQSAKARIEEMMGFGTGCIEIKSGYGLSVEGELKMLRVIKRLKETMPVKIKSTFLGAHALPKEYKENRSGYIDLIIQDMLPTIQKEGLADYIDVFCDKGFFTIEETDRLLQAGNAIGLQAKIHANELDFSGGIQVGVKNAALSVDHLEFTGEEEMEVLLNSDTMPTLLPSTAFFLRISPPPARKMLEKGLPLALATDFNPGSSPSGNFPFVLSLACILLKMLPEEAINAATLNSAYAMGLESEYGSIAVGKKANIFITKEMNSLSFLPYSFGSNLVEKLILNGKVLVDKESE
jgi:imidazolonepropionase